MIYLVESESFPSPDDTQLSDQILKEAVEYIESQVEINNEFDIPYTAGYNKSGTHIYIDRHLPEELDGTNIYPLIAIHEIIESTIIERFPDIPYQYAHQIALRVEKESTKAFGLDWETYDSFCQEYIKQIGDETLEDVPGDLSLVPYEDEGDTEEIEKINRAKR